MNGTVERMLDLTTDREAEIAFLEGLFEEDCKCESAHQKAVAGPCSGVAVAKCVPGCGMVGALWCQSALDAANRSIAGGFYRCALCGSKIGECWTITLI